MKYVVLEMEELLVLNDPKSKNTVTLKGYAFVNEHKGCFIIAYGERKRDLMIKYLEQL